jgi:putative transposase
VFSILKEANEKVSKSLVARVMKKYGFRSLHAKKFKVTTDSKHSHPVADNVLDSVFSATRAGEKWVSDLTYIHTKEGWLYLTMILDLYDRKVVGWSMSDNMTTSDTSVKSWEIAVNNRPILKDLLFHSDRGVQYASDEFTKTIKHPKITQIMSRKGNCWDNAVAESFFKTIKHEWLYRFRFKSFEQLYSSIEEYIHWYNTKRLHSTLNYLSPLEMELKLRNNIKKAA